jgi:hypothetical protein
MSSLSDYLITNRWLSSAFFKALLMAAILASATSAQAQRIIEGNTKVDLAVQEQLFRALREELPDPSSATMIGIRTGQDGVICGLIDAKTVFGKSTGYKPFAFDPEKRRLGVLPPVGRDLDLSDDHWQEKLNAIREAARWVAIACPTSEGK